MTFAKALSGFPGGKDPTGLAGDMPALLLVTIPFDLGLALTLDSWAPSAGQSESERKTNRCERKGQVTATPFRPVYNILATS